MAADRPHILILGAGINGCALARELLLNDAAVTVVDDADISYGATAYSSRLIHGGLRYLEYGEFDLVRESLAERTRLLKLAPQFVRPLELFIPVDNRWGGLWSSAGKLFGWNKGSGPAKRRGAWLVRMGLWFYDRYARDPSLPKHRTHTVGSPDAVRVDDGKFRWLLSYYDAQVHYPERFTLALLLDARQIAVERNVPLEVHTYSQAEFDGGRVRIRATLDRGDRRAGDVLAEFEPSVIVNATGAWVDLTMERLGVRTNRLMGGTKGSHLITFNERLRACLNGKGIYAEAPDGRPIFILPFGAAVLVGTTDEPYSGDPADAVASDAELAYLLSAVNEIVPQAGITAADIALHYSGVRPLPHANAASTAAITRRHWMQEIPEAPVPLYSVIGGKLTTCRSLAEEATATLLKRVGQPVRETSRERVLPGAADFPHDAVEERVRIEQLGMHHQLDEDQVRALWSLCGTDFEQFLPADPSPTAINLVGTHLPIDIVRRMIANEWVTTLDDLIERRLMLVFHPELSEACLRQLAEMLVAAGKLSADKLEQEIERTTQRLAQHFGKQVTQAASTPT